jgi:hypothetical protein
MGYSYDVNGVQHGFQRSPDGTFTTFDPTGSTYTMPSGINIWGAITGFYDDATGLQHGFLRAPGGAITSFDPPSSNYTNPTSISDLWAITGVWEAPYDHGFLRGANGTFTVFDVPGATYTWNVVGFTLTGAIGGSYLAPPAHQQVVWSTASCEAPDAICVVLTSELTSSNKLRYRSAAAA